MKKQYNIFYYHGLESFLSEEKKNILERFGNVHAPKYNYHNSEILQTLNNSFVFDESTVLIGSSFGGWVANMFSGQHDLPCLLFNPALPYRSIYLESEAALEKNISSLSYIVLGKYDEVIKCEDNSAFISTYFKGPTEVVIEEAMAHGVPVDIFEKHVTRFFNQLNNERILSG